MLYPWHHAPSRVFGRIGSGEGHERRGKWQLWRNVGAEAWEGFLAGLLASLPRSDRLWLTIDKDVLRPEEAATNWDQGEMPLAALLAALQRLCGSGRVFGADVCGDYAQARLRQPLKRLSAWLDRPRAAAAPDLERNSRTNAALIDAFAQALP